MFPQETIKRKPGRPFGSFSKKRFGHSSSSKKKTSNNSFKSWNTNSKPKPVPVGKGKPPGRPWHSNSVKKVCLLCLQQFNQSSSPEASSDEDEEEEEDKVKNANGDDNSRDPLADDVVTDMAVDLMNSSKETRGTVKIPKKKKAGLYVRFLTILNRQLKISTKRFKNSALRNDLRAPFCENCNETVKQLCIIYEEWQTARLGLQWRLQQISDSIKVSKVSVSGKLHCTLLKSLSTQLRVVSSRCVDILRKQVSIQCSGKIFNQVPRVAINKHSVMIAVKENWKWKFAFDQMKQYLSSLIVVFALAVPPKNRPEKKPLPLIGPKSKIRRVGFADIKHAKENVPPHRDVKVKREPGHDGGEEGEGDDHHPADDDDHFGGGDHSPPGSGPVSPVGGEAEEDDPNKNDSDWSAGAASGNDSAGSDVEFSVNRQTVRRWNLRRRVTRSKSNAGGDGGDDSDTEYVPGTLPPLRNTRHPRSRDLPEAEKKFSCNLCNAKFAMDRGLKRHLGQAHAFLMIYNCPKCPNLRFRKRKELDAHRRKVHPTSSGKPGSHLSYMGIPTACTACDKMFPSKMKMIIHRRTHKLMSILHTCEICGKVIRGKVRLDHHMKTHFRPDKPHRCEKCPRSFRTEEGLAAHMTFHESNPNWIPWTRDKNPERKREGVFPCDIEGCKKIFYKRSNLTIHKSLHTDEFGCLTCDFKSTAIKEFRSHLKTHETEEKKYFCYHCDKSFTMEQSYDIHKKIAHPTKPTLPCDIDDCQEEFENTEQLRQHLKTMHLPPDVEETKEDVKFYDVYGTGKKPSEKSSEDADVKVPPADSKPAQETDQKSSTSESAPPPPEGGDLENKPTTEGQNMFEDLLLINPGTKKEESGEIPTEPPRLYTCVRCDWSFCKKILYSLHLILHTPRDERRLYKCDLCERSFAVVDSLQTHYNRIHGPKIKPYLCLICGVRFHRRESFIPHMRIHNDKETAQTFDCDKCEKKFFDSVNLNKHRRMVHEVRRDGTMKDCDLCEEKFASKFTLMTHKVDVHGMEKPYKCHMEGCEKSFLMRTQLTDHKICHGEASFKCTLCPKAFKRRHNLADHYLVHKQEKNHFCEYCGRAFVKKSSLNLHLDIHREIKKYTCEYCGKAFCRKYARDCHLRVHTKERPYKCQICGRDFAQYSALSIHRKNHEKLNNDTILRRPFRKSIGIGKPLKPRRKKKTENGIEEVVGEEEEETSLMGAEGGNEKVEKSKEESTSYSGILHEAMKATFDDINMELEIGVQNVEPLGQGQAPPPPVIGVLQVIDERNAMSAVAAVEQETVPKDEKDDEEEEEEVEEAPVKVQKTRKPKVYKKEYSCGFCGKTFRREDFYSKHVDKHMAEVEASGGGASQQSHISQQSSLMEIEEHNSLQDVLQDEPLPPAPPPPQAHHSLRRRSVPSAVGSVSSSPINVPQPHVQQQIYQPPPPPPPPLAPAPPTVVQPQPVPQQPAKRRGRPPKQNGAPGSRLAKIVEDVLETAINRPSSSSTRYHHQQQNQYHQQHQQQQQLQAIQHHHHVGQSPSPHHMTHSPSPHQMVHSGTGSEKSTPTGSPAPSQHHHQQQQQQQQPTVTTTSTPAFSSSASAAASFLSPFLFSNPYLIPRMSMSDQQTQGGIQQDPMFSGFQNRQQQSTFSQQSLQHQPSVNYPQQQFHQLPISTSVSSQSSARTMPQDLSKNNNYSIFYHNQR